MSARETEIKELPPLAHEALGWVVRLTSGGATTADAAAFEAWRAQRPAHAEAFRDAVAFREALRAMPLQDSPIDNNLVAFRAPSRAALINRRAMLVGGGAIAASAAFAVLNPPYGLWPSWSELSAGERTGTGERRTLEPMAGVTIEMNARTALSLIAGGAAMVTGEAFVAVRGGQLFSIRVGDEQWFSKDAEFNVRIGAHSIRITCLSGKILRDSGSPKTIFHGQQYVAQPGKPGRIARTDPVLAGGWRRGLLIYRDTALAEVIEDINRYRPGRIILANAPIGERPVSGMFHIAQIDNAVEQLQQLLGMKVTELAGGVVVLR